VATTISSNIQTIRETIRRAAQQSGRDPASVCLVAATKTVSCDQLEEAYAAQIRHFGENRLQEAQEKMEQFGSREGLSWHFIGRMQRRKLKALVGQFCLLHSVESLEQAQSINAVAEKLGIQQAVLLEVNVGEEASKGGFTSQEVEARMGDLDRLPHVRIQGLMTLPPWKENPEDVRSYFTQVSRLRDRLAEQSWTRVRMTELSMGMSHDYEIAIEEGATMVRIGTAIFGKREKAVSPSTVG